LLQELKAHHCRRSDFRKTGFDRTVRELVDLLSRGRRVDSLDAVLFRHALPRLRHVAIEGVGIEAMHRFPGSLADYDNLYRLPQPLAT
jgi:hypothetical protein